MTTEEKLKSIKAINKEIDAIDFNLKQIDKGDFFQIAVDMDNHSLREMLAEYWRNKKNNLFQQAEALMK